MVPPVRKYSITPVALTTISPNVHRIVPTVRKDSSTSVATCTTKPKYRTDMYMRGRYICSMESMWKVFHFQTYPATKPSVSKITVKLPSHVNSLFDDGKMCNVWFEHLFFTATSLAVQAGQAVQATIPPDYYDCKNFFINGLYGE